MRQGSIGISMVAFGRSYLGSALASIRYSSQFTDLPFAVAVLEEDFGLAKEEARKLGNVRVLPFRTTQDQNRRAKLSIWSWTPWTGLTFYMDADSVVQRSGLDGLLAALPHEGSVFVRKYDLWTKDQKIPRIYAEAMTQFQAKPPLLVLQGGCFAFRPDQTALSFLAMWQAMWDAFGRGREMPCLACAYQTVSAREDARFRLLPDEIFQDEREAPEALVQHCYKPELFEKFGLPKLERLAPPPHGEGDWNFVEMPQ